MFVWTVCLSIGWLSIDDCSVFPSQVGVDLPLYYLTLPSCMHVCMHLIHRYVSHVHVHIYTITSH